jgi:hypothetical protein
MTSSSSSEIIRIQLSLSSILPGAIALYAVTGNNRFFSYIEPKFGLSVLFVEAMAGETVVGQDWPDITIVTYFAFFWRIKKTRNTQKQEEDGF